jgi:hypothetical protein
LIEPFVSEAKMGRGREVELGWVGGKDVCFVARGGWLEAGGGHLVGLDIGDVEAFHAVEKIMGERRRNLKLIM